MPNADSSDQTVPQEVELKLVVLGEDAAETLAEIARVEQIGRVRLGPLSRRTIHDLYWDTPNRALGARHVTLRVRTVDGAVLLTTKGATQVQDGLFSRRELEVSADRAGWERVRGALELAGVTLPDVIADAPGPADWLSASGLVITQDRVTARAVRIAYEGERPVAELALDATRYNVGGRAVDCYEVEIEQLATGGAVRSLGRALMARFPGRLEPARFGKYARGLQLERELNARQRAD